MACSPQDWTKGQGQTRMAINPRVIPPPLPPTLPQAGGKVPTHHPASQAGDGQEGSSPRPGMPHRPNPPPKRGAGTRAPPDTRTNHRPGSYSAPDQQSHKPHPKAWPWHSATAATPPHQSLPAFLPTLATAWKPVGFWQGGDHWAKRALVDLPPRNACTKHECSTKGKERKGNPEEEGQTTEREPCGLALSS